jgi:hypothetical protein
MPNGTLLIEVMFRCTGSVQHRRHDHLVGIRWTGWARGRIYLPDRDDFGECRSHRHRQDNHTYVDDDMGDQEQSFRNHKKPS